MSLDRNNINKSKNFPEFIFSFFKMMYKKFLKLHLLVRILICILIILFLLLPLARLRIFGDPWYQLAKMICPFYLLGIDIPLYTVPMKVEFQIKDEMGTRLISQGDPCKTGAFLTISFQAQVDCYFMIVRVDSRKIQLVFPGTGNADFLKGNEAYSLDSFPLDNAVGKEFYYFIASGKIFTYAKDIEKYFQKLYPEGHLKGNAMEAYELKLPGSFTLKRFYFEHIN